MAALMSISGVASGLNTDEIIQKVLTVERAPIGKLQMQQASLKTQMAAFQEANTRLQALQDAAYALARMSAFQAKSVTSSNEDVLTASATIGAVASKYTITVEQLALTHQVKSQAFTDTDATRVGTGQLTLQVGDGSLITIDVDESNNTLAGLRDAINRQQAGMTASIIQEADSSYRLMLTSDHSGVDYAITVDASGLSGGTAPTFTNLQDAQNARIVLGSGTGQITVEKSSNTVDDLIAGTTLNLHSTSATPVTVTVTADREGLRKSIQNLVDQYNNAIDFINTQFKFDPETLQGGVLLGNTTLAAIQQDVDATINAVVAGLTTGKNVLSYVGVSLDADGKLSFDGSEFEDAFDEDPVAVGRLFAVDGQTTDDAISFQYAGAKTVPSATGYLVHITQVATRARVTAGVAQTQQLNNDETLTINGVTVALAKNSTQADVISAINAVSGETGVRAEATGIDGTGTGNYLTLWATKYGSSYKISVSSSVSNGGATPASNTTGVGLTLATEASPAGEAGTGTGAAGQDVAGTIGGEAARGSGQTLVGDSDNSFTAGLQIQVRATTPGDYGAVKVTAGIAFRLSNLLDQISNTTDGRVKAELDTMQEQVDDLQSVIDAKEEGLGRKEEQLRLKFVRLEEMMARFQTLSAQLSAQLRGLGGFQNTR
ncbi:MAG: flagellar filament capping protein FliD [Armatimonadetes bacterium]|nr:flagellar filament capping protein FliD [Armatimonadota bacterium]